MAYQTRDAVEAMVAVSGTPLDDLRVDGGASAMDVLLHLQADQLGVPVRRPADLETTSLGAAFLAGLAEGVWPTLGSLEERWVLDAEALPNPDRTVADGLHAKWLQALTRARP
jgi:glycerol kinase